MSSQNNSKDRVKFDSEVLLRYIYDYSLTASNEPNVIKICRVKVRKTGGAVLAHYYAQVFVSNKFSFEFHPGSQPKTFQNVDTEKEHLPVCVKFMCDECTKQELRDYIEGENQFNIAFKNCESILCKRKSVQTVIITILIVVLLINLVNFSALNIIVIAFLLILLYIVNNYLLSKPKVSICKHYKLNKRANFIEKICK
ncbi:ORF94 [Agrotis segetum granulovirus]|uniref:ORF94 n=1 Tax=Agrotis segetum granulosis virus TaxID=10464 RepID=Q6QXL4_GVAS|nr:hypothetical protein AsGV108 [Agrotis segetum granulovirus]AAS82644.1 ORF94 [Agrotis segetum granulovirus]AHN92144.1 hypothetical protein AsGV105 [Agrotis segetum granulovirus]AKN63382.1 hypothetical protein AsGV108 [Agrotis segetum granulovirus]